MKKLALIASALFVFLGATAIAACKTQKASTETVTITKNVEAFSKIDAFSALTVIYKQGDRYSVTIRIPEHMQEYFKFRQIGDEIEFGFKPPKSMSINNNNAGTIVTVTSPRIREIELSGACSFVAEEISQSSDKLEIDLSGATSVKIGNLKAKKLEVEASGASNINIGKLIADKTEIDISGASSTTISGVTSLLKVDVSGATAVNLENLKAQEGSIEASGAAKVNTNILRVTSSECSGMSRIKNSTSK